MTKTEFLVRAVTQRFNLVVVNNEIAIRAQQVISHQVRIVGRREDLTRQREQTLANFKGEFKMIEGIKFINEDKRSVFHPAHPEIQQLQVLCSGGSNHIERYPFFVKDAEKILVSGVRFCKMEILFADFIQEFFKIAHKIVLDDVFIKQGGVGIQSDELPDIQTSEP